MRHVKEQFLLILSDQLLKNEIISNFLNIHNQLIFILKDECQICFDILYILILYVIILYIF